MFRSFGSSAGSSITRLVYMIRAIPEAELPPAQKPKPTADDLIRLVVTEVDDELVIYSAATKTELHLPKADLPILQKAVSDLQ